MPELRCTVSEAFELACQREQRSMAAQARLLCEAWAAGAGTPHVTRAYAPTGLGMPRRLGTVTPEQPSSSHGPECRIDDGHPCNCQEQWRRDTSDPHNPNCPASNAQAFSGQPWVCTCGADQE